MNGFVDYFRQHPWQRRVIMLLVALVISLSIAIPFYPAISDYYLIRRLGDDSPAIHENAIMLASARLRASKQTLRRMERALETDNDRRFLGVASALNRASRFHTPERSVDMLDRFKTLLFETSPAARSRWLILHEQCLADRDNVWLRRLLAAATADSDATVRELATVFAAKFADPTALGTLLADDEPTVRAAAALNAAIAGQSGLTETIAGLLADADELTAASAAYALAMLDPQTHSMAICTKLIEAQNLEARNRLLTAAVLLNDDNARAAVRKILVQLPPPEGEDIRAYADGALLRAVAALRMDGAEAVVRPILAAALRLQGEVTDVQLLAALATADELGLPIRQEVYDIMQARWHSDVEPTMIVAARVLGRQAALPQQDRSAPTEAECIQLLRNAATWDQYTDDPTDDQPPVILKTPLASAAASVALWELQAKEASEWLANAAGADVTLPGDYIAWRLAMSDRPADAFAVGQKLLPAPGSPPELWVHNNNERSAGAMLLALAARTDAQRAQASDCIRGRLEGTGLGGEHDPFVSRAYHCALVILGRRDTLEEVYGYTAIVALPQWRTLTSLMAAGDARALDWMLWNRQLPEDLVVELLVDRQLGPVVAAVAPGLPRVDPAAPFETQAWQTMVLSNTYAIHHASIQLQRLP